MQENQDLLSQKEALGPSSTLSITDIQQSPPSSSENRENQESYSSSQKSTLSELYKDEIEEIDIELRDIKNKGRGLVASKTIKAGSRILRTNPVVSVLSTPHLTKTCHGCFLTLQEKEILMASRNISANTVVSSEADLRASLFVLHLQCQLSDWSAHKPECMALKRLRQMYFKTYPGRLTTEGDTEEVQWAGSEGVRLLGRICWRRREERSRSGGIDGVWENQQDVKSLPEKGIMQLARQVQHLSHYLSASVSLQAGADETVLEPTDMSIYGFAGVSQLLDLCSSIQVNAFTLTSSTLSPIGVSISPLVALTNHSCEPSAVAVFAQGGCELDVVALRDIQIDEEILISYIDTSTPHSHRQTELYDRYCFNCNCTLCLKSEQDESWIDPRWCVWHPGCRKKGIGKMPSHAAVEETRIKCGECHEIFSVDIDRLKTLTKKGLDLLTDEERGCLDTASAMENLNALLPLLLNHVPSSSHPAFALLRLHTVLFIDSTMYENTNFATSYLALAYSGALQVLPANHPTLAVILAEWGKLLCVDKSRGSCKGEDGRQGLARSLEKIIPVLRNAVAASQRGFGGNGGVLGIEMEGLARSCEGELILLRAKNVESI
nr:hypothetical protein L203_00613 [Cryptococcus depauperatus CBS 7841]